MRYRLAIFDMDGTILDTLQDLHDSLNAALSMNDMPIRTMDEVKSFVGNGMWKLIERGVPAGTNRDRVVKVHDDFMSYYKDHCADHTKPYDGIVDLIHTLKRAGCMTAVVSNKADAAVHDLCKAYFPDCFDCEIGSREGIANKPAPDSVLEVLTNLKCSKEEAVYIGDSDVDVETARNAKVNCIAVSWGFRSVDFLKEHGADVIADEAKQIATYIL